MTHCDNCRTWFRLIIFDRRALNCPFRNVLEIGVDDFTIKGYMQINSQQCSKLFHKSSNNMSDITLPSSLNCKRPLENEKLLTQSKNGYFQSIGESNLWTRQHLICWSHGFIERWLKSNFGQMGCYETIIFGGKRFPERIHHSRIGWWAWAVVKFLVGVIRLLLAGIFAAICTYSRAEQTNTK